MERRTDNLWRCKKFFLLITNLKLFDCKVHLLRWPEAQPIRKLFFELSFLSWRCGFWRVWLNGWFGGTFRDDLTHFNCADFNRRIRLIHVLTESWRQHPTKCQLICLRRQISDLNRVGVFFAHQKNHVGEVKRGASKQSLFCFRVLCNPGDLFFRQFESFAIEPGHSAERLLDIRYSAFSHEEAWRLRNKECQDCCEKADSTP